MQNWTACSQRFEYVSARSHSRSWSRDRDVYPGGHKGVPNVQLLTFETFFTHNT